MLNVRKNAYRNESQTDAYWRIKQQKHDEFMCNLVAVSGIVIMVGGYIAFLFSPIAHF